MGNLAQAFTQEELSNCFQEVVLLVQFNIVFLLHPFGYAWRDKSVAAIDGDVQVSFYLWYHLLKPATERAVAYSSGTGEFGFEHSFHCFIR